MSTPRPQPFRFLWIAAGFVFVGLGFVGAWLPLMPSTVFFLLAAWCFSRSSPRFLAWLLDLPVAGPLVRDFRAGVGMPLRAKIVACLMILTSVGFSARYIPVLIGQVVWIALGLFGVWYILTRVPTKSPSRGDA